MESYTSPPTLVTGAIIVVGLALCLYRAALPKPIPGIPYHRSAVYHPLGDTLDFLAYSIREGDMFGLLPIRLRQLQSPIMQIFVRPLQRPWVVVSDPLEANDILTRRTREFDRSRFFGDIFQPLLPHNHLHMATGPEWSAHRRLMGDTMSSSFLLGVAGPLFWTSAQDMIKLWKIKIRLAEGRPFSAAQDVYSTALEVVWHAVFGFEPGSTEAQIELLSTKRSIRLPVSLESAVDFPRAKNPAAFDSILTLTDSLDIPITSIIPKTHYLLALNLTPKLIASSRHKDALIKERMKIAKEKITNLTADVQGNERYTSAVDLVVHREKIMAEKEGREPDYDSRVIADELFGFLVAGHDTTSTTLRWAIKLLAADQRIQSKLRAELQAAFVHARSAGDQPTIEDINSHDIPYLEAVMAEIHRKSITTVAVSRTALVDTTVLGHHIPKGTNVLFLSSGPGIQTPAMPVDDSRRSKTSLQAKEKYPHWDPENIERFVPERWLRTSADGTGSEEFNSQAGPAFPFGAGPRACFGRKWAQLELRVILTLIIWNFELQPPPAELASFKAVDKNTHQPQQCYVQLVEVK